MNPKIIRTRVVVENHTLDGIVRVEGPWRNVPDGMPPEKVCEHLFRAALGDIKHKPQEEVLQGGA